MHDWTADIETALENIRVNCVVLTKVHKKEYFKLNYYLKFFRLPVIFLSGVNSIVSVGLQNYVKQTTISLTTCILALVCSLIGSIELYLTLQKRMETELLLSKDCYLLSIDIQKTLILSPEHRPMPAKDYLEKCYNDYIKMIENSNLINVSIADKLTPLKTELIQNIISKPSEEYFFSYTENRPQLENPLSSLEPLPDIETPSSIDSSQPEPKEDNEIKLTTDYIENVKDIEEARDSIEIHIPNA